jgi:hypothetical protein
MRKDGYVQEGLLYFAEGLGANVTLSMAEYGASSFTVCGVLPTDTAYPNYAAIVGQDGSTNAQLGQINSGRFGVRAANDAVLNGEMAAQLAEWTAEPYCFFSYRRIWSPAGAPYGNRGYARMSYRERFCVLTPSSAVYKGAYGNPYDKTSTPNVAFRGAAVPWAMAALYGRELSDAEILWNYQAWRARS